MITVKLTCWKHTEHVFEVDCIGGIVREVSGCRPTHKLHPSQMLQLRDKARWAAANAEKHRALARKAVAG